MERVRRVELPTLCLASAKSTRENEKNSYKSTRRFPSLPYFSPTKVKNFSLFIYTTGQQTKPKRSQRAS